MESLRGWRLALWLPSALLAVSCGASTSADTTRHVPLDRAQMGQPTTRAASGVAPSTVIQWGVGQALWGEETIGVDVTGRVDYRFQPAGPDRPETGGGQFSEAEVDAMLQTLRDEQVCSLRSERAGIPDEGSPTLQLQSAEARCSVTLWDGEWRERAPNVLRLVNGLRRRARGQ